MTNLDRDIKKQRHYFANKGPSSQNYCFPSSHVWMWELDYKENRAQKNWFFWTVVLEKTIESSLDSKEIQPVHPKGDQSWVFTGRTDTEAKTPILWPPDVKNWLIWKDPDAGKDWRLEEKGTTEDEMVAWHHWVNGHEFEQTPGDGEGQGSLVCCSPWVRKESDMAEWLNNNKCSPDLQLRTSVQWSIGHSFPLSRWCHLTISSSVVPCSSHLQSFPASGSFPVSWLFASGGQRIGVSALHQAFQWIFKVDFL